MLLLQQNKLGMQLLQPLPAPESDRRRPQRQPGAAALQFCKVITFSSLGSHLRRAWLPA
jgi:hypothetical protein